MSTLNAAINASASALDAQRARIEVAVSNLANAESTRGADGQPYRRRDVVLDSRRRSSRSTRRSAAPAPSACKVADVVEDQAPFRRRYEPSHPDADADGFVAMPNVDVPEEMVDMLGAARAYQANLTAIGLIRDTIQTRPGAGEISHGDRRAFSSISAPYRQPPRRRPTRRRAPSGGLRRRAQPAASASVDALGRRGQHGGRQDARRHRRRARRDDRAAARRHDARS